MLGQIGFKHNTFICKFKFVMILLSLRCELEQTNEIKLLTNYAGIKGC